MIKMESGLKSRWIDALTGGEYLQARGTLFDGYVKEEGGKPKMCCLGVLEHICGTPPEEMETCEMPDVIPDAGANSPDDVLNQLIPTDGVSKKLCAILADMNDTGKSFEQIAEYIKENL